MCNLTSQNRHKEKGTDIPVPHIDEGFKGVKKNVYRLDIVSIANVNYKQFYLDGV